MSDIISPSYPSLSWVRSQLRWNATSNSREKVLAAYIVGSEAKGTARPDSDLDIAIIVAPHKRVSAIQKSERYHQKFTSDQQKPKWNGRIVDLQFFYPDDKALLGYTKIELQATRRVTDAFVPASTAATPKL